MSADELLPLLDFPNELEFPHTDSWMRQAIRDYATTTARVNVAHATAGLRAEWRSLGVCAVAAENASVAEYCRHLEGRAERAEAELAAAREDAARLRAIIREVIPFIGWTGSYPELIAKCEAATATQEQK